MIQNEHYQEGYYHGLAVGSSLHGIMFHILPPRPVSMVTDSVISNIYLNGFVSENSVSSSAKTVYLNLILSTVHAKVETV